MYDIMIPYKADLETRITNISTDNDDDRTTMFRLLNQRDGKLNEIVGKTISMRAFYIEGCELTDRNTGDLVTRPSIRIITTDDKVYTTTSLGVYYSLRNICGCFGPGPWPDGFKVTVNPTGNGSGIRLDLA